MVGDKNKPRVRWQEEAWGVKSVDRTCTPVGSDKNTSTSGDGKLKALFNVSGGTSGEGADDGGGGD